MKYSTAGRREQKAAAAAAANENGEVNNGKKNKLGMKGRSRKNKNDDEREKVRNVKQMPFTDQFGDFGYYSGQVTDEGKPDGKGTMKYENGVFYEGTWTTGCQDKLAAANYERIRGGFTSWSGKGKSGTKSGMVLPWNARKNDAHNALEKTNTRGMEWTDLNGDSGRYTGEVNNDQLPHGNGIMRYDFGLIAEGEWVNGFLKEGPGDRMMGVAAAMNGGQSVVGGAPPASGMSIGPGATGFASGAVSVLGGGGISVAPSGGFGGGMNLMAAASRHPAQHAMIAHQNAMMKAAVMGGAGSVYGGGAAMGGAGSVYGGVGAAGSVFQMQQQQQQAMMQPQQMHLIQQQQQMQMQMQQQKQSLENQGPPIPEIKLG